MNEKFQVVVRGNWAWRLATSGLRVPYWKFAERVRPVPWEQLKNETAHSPKEVR